MTIRRWHRELTEECRCARMTAPPLDRRLSPTIGAQKLRKTPGILYIGSYTLSVQFLLCWRKTKGKTIKVSFRQRRGCREVGERRSKPAKHENRSISCQSATLRNEGIEAFFLRNLACASSRAHRSWTSDLISTKSERIMYSRTAMDATSD